MKRILIALFVVLLCTPAYAVDIEVRGYQMIYSDSDVDSHPGVELRVKHKFAYVWASVEEFRAYGNWSNLFGAGLGLRHNVYKGIWVWVQGGYYKPDVEDRMFAGQSGWFLKYALDMDGEWGGEVGLDAKFPIMEGVYLGVSTSYRFLSFTEERGYYYIKGDFTQKLGQINHHQDFDGLKLGLTLEYRF